MVKTVRVSEEYHVWLSAHKREDETMEETLRRMTRGPHPDDVAGLLWEEEAETAKQAVERLRGRDRDRLAASRSACEKENEVETDDRAGEDARVGPNDAYTAAMADVLDDAVLTTNVGDFEALGVPVETY